MNAAAHTPGPWMANGDIVRARTGRGTDTVIIAATAAATTTDERASNARLIAAAPDMLAALKRALATIENTLRARGYADGESTDTWSGEVRIEVATRAKLRAAIAKAESRS